MKKANGMGQKILLVELNKFVVCGIMKKE